MDKSFSSSPDSLPHKSSQRLAGVFEQLEAIPQAMEAAWAESDERRRRVERMEELLERGELLSPFDQENFVKGLRLSLGFFSKRQLEQLERLTERLGEGLAEQHEQERFEKGNEKTGIVEEHQQAVEVFNALILNYYELVARLALAGRKKEEIEGLMKVAWTSVEACAAALFDALKQGKTATEMDLIVFRYEQQLNALDPENPFVPSKK